MADVWIIALLRLKKMNKYSKKILLLILFGFIILNIIAPINNYFKKKERLNLTLKGVVEGYNVSPKEFIEVKINNNWYKLGFIEEEFLNEISEGDSLIKFKDSFHCELYRKNDDGDYELIYKGDGY